MLLYINTASLVLDVFQIFSIVYHNRAGAFHPFGIENAAPAYAVTERGERRDDPGTL
jgi:hypothetical protein